MIERRTDKAQTVDRIHHEFRIVTQMGRGLSAKQILSWFDSNTVLQFVNQELVKKKFKGLDKRRKYDIMFYVK